eukprot:COSAG03_NODE_2065_length_3160_cov_2.661222_4_plen_75_part_01
MSYEEIRQRRKSAARARARTLSFMTASYPRSTTTRMTPPPPTAAAAAAAATSSRWAALASSFALNQAERSAFSIP